MQILSVGDVVLSAQQIFTKFYVRVYVASIQFVSALAWVFTKKSFCLLLKHIVEVEFNFCWTDCHHIVNVMSKLFVVLGLSSRVNTAEIIYYIFSIS